METYDEKLAVGTVYQDHVQRNLWLHGLVIQTYASKQFQFQFGETIGGLEIKYDRRYRDTGNLYIEVAEKSNAANANYVPSGIYRSDNAWLYGIGNEAQFWIFSKAHLRRYYESFFELHMEQLGAGTNSDPELRERMSGFAMILSAIADGLTIQSMVAPAHFNPEVALGALDELLTCTFPELDDATCEDGRTA